eukprot:scaffold4555_cov63-Phaeocystis_antarctica.AAC.2
MDRMFVTLDVSKLSGWLNAFASCRVERRACDAGEVRPGRREGVGWRRRKQRARAGSDSSAVGARVCAERTVNMPLMSLTLDVSKLSGWLNTLAYCRESKGGHTVQGK